VDMVCSVRNGSVRFGSCEGGRVRARVRVQGGIRCVDVSALFLRCCCSVCCIVSTKRCNRSHVKSVGPTGSWLART
jgi:hypothetical protein